MVYSLPIKRKYKFLSDFFSGLSVYLVPYIAACILSDLILLSGALCIENMNELLTDFSAFTIIFQCEFAGLLMMTLLYALTVLVLNCCGTLFESVMNIFILNGLIPGVIAVIAAMFFAGLHGVSIFESILPVLGYTSPIGAVIYLAYLAATSSVSEMDLSVFIPAGVFCKWAVLFFLFTAVVFALSMFLYMKRKAEDVSKPYVYKLLYYMVITSVVMAISLIARYEISAIVPVIVFSLIVYLIFEVITNRGFKKIYKSFIRYAITMVAILILGVVSSATDGFGAEGRIPSVDSVKNVRVSYQGFDRSVASGHYIYADETTDRNNILVYDQKDIIEKIIDVHEDAIEFYQTGEYDNAYSDGYYENEYGKDYPYYEVRFSYNLKTGSKLTRTYTLTYNQVQKLFALDSTPQMSKFYKEKLMFSMKSEYYYDRQKRGRYNVYISNGSEIHSDAEEHDISREQAMEIADAYEKDYSNMTTEQMLTDDVYCYLNGDFVVRKSFVNTIACLEKYNFTVPEITASNFVGADCVLFAPSGVKCWEEDAKTSSFGIYNANYDEGHELSSEQTAQLFKLGMLKRPYCVDQDCYTVFIYDNIFVIPYEFSDYAENLMNQTVPVDHIG